MYNIHRNNNLKILMFSFLGISLIILIWTLFIVENSFFNTLAFFIALTLIFMVFIINLNISTNVKVISFIFFSIKIIFLIIYSSGNDIIIFPDSHNYLLHLDKILASGDYSLSNLQYIAGTLHVGHYYSMLVPYSILGTPESILVYNSLIISISITLLYKVFEESFGEKIAMFTLIFSSLSLNLSLFGSFILKDSTVVLLGALVVYFMRVKQRPYIAILLSLALFTVRIYAGFAFLLAIIFEMIFINQKKTTRMFKIISLIALSIFFTSILAVPAVSIYFDKSFVYAKEMIGSGLLTGFLTSLSKFFFAPLPWNVISNYDVYTLLVFDSLIFLLLSFSLILFIIKFLRYKRLRLKMWLFIIPIVVHAIVLGYEYQGDSTRQRIGIFIFLILIVPVGLLYKQKEKAIVD